MYLAEGIRIIYAIIFLALISLYYISNSSFELISIRALNWLAYFLFAIIFLKSIEFISIIIPLKRAHYLGVYFFLAPFFPMLNDLFGLRGLDFRFRNFPSIVNNIMQVAILLYLSYLYSLRLYKEKLFLLAHEVEKLPLNLEVKKLKYNDLSEPGNILGNGNSVFDRVIKCTLSRASAATVISRNSLYVMVTLVILGGGLSIATISLDQFSKIRDLEKHRQLLLSIIEQLDYGQLAKDNQNDLVKKLDIESTMLARIDSTINTTYGPSHNEKDYKQLLENIYRKENLNITEIVLRIVITAMILFLVQVFFLIYRYNQHLSAGLLAKAELLELFGEEGSDRGKLREVLASKLEENAKFGKSPSTPIEQIINVTEKAAK